MGAGALVAAVMALGLAPLPARAYVAYGTVLVPGSSWAGSLAAIGDLNVYSNGNGNQDQWGTYGLNYECVELATRYVALRYGVSPWSWHISYAYQMYAAGPTLSVPFTQLPNGGAVAPQFGDLLIFNKTAGDYAGHVAVVSGVGGGYVNIVEQNWNNANPTGYARLPISGTYMPPRPDGVDPGGLPILGWLRAYNEPAGVQGPAGPGGYTLDASGGIHPYGSAIPLTQPDQLPGGLARGVALIPPTGTQTVSQGGYTLDGYGGVHAFGNAPSVRVSSYWYGWDIARGIVLAPGGKSGYVLDGWGGLHPFAQSGTSLPATPKTSAYWPHWDIARGISLLPGSTSQGYVLDGWGGLHPFGGAPSVAVSAFWPKWDIARGVAVNTTGPGGYVVDGWGGVHPFGGAAPRSTKGYFPNQDVVRGIVVNDAFGGYTTSVWGKVYPFGAEVPVDVSATFSAPLAQGMAKG